MSVDIRNTQLMRFLAEQYPHYHSKALELRESVVDWLSYIPATFPHYTRHTIGHSEEIISQMSKILFVKNDYRKPVLPEMSGIEAYILVASAYLHDAGMTVSDSEKTSILKSPEWKEWVEEGSGADRFKAIKEFREGKGGSLDDTTRTFLSDVQLRFLIAEFVRRTHHIRGGDILALYQNKMGRFGYDDDVLIRTIADVCVAHGLQQNELNDPERFPERRDIRDELVNVRLMALLLRIGDLLDMNSDRACPLLLNAASPIPADSLAHWTQYKCITHKMVGEDEIQLTAECHNEEEHRFLHDWCAWLVSELDQAQRLMVRSTRHTGWVPPVATIDRATGGNTINIKAAKGAKYIPAQWRFELDTKAIFNRLIYDAIDNPWDFLRELIQNAADATRCRMFDDLQKSEGETPQYPTQVDERIRDAYPIRVTLGITEVYNDLSQEKEERQVLTVEDFGIGMDQDVIQKYLLQVGRSFYTTREFRDSFGFVASSRFGIGFLSVFGVSDDVTIETHKPTSQISTMPLKLKLTGPRSYLLTEKGSRSQPGTRIDIILRKQVEQGVVTNLVRDWCGRLEFPVIVSDLGKKREIRSEQTSIALAEALVVESGDKLVIRKFPADVEGIEGWLFVLARLGEAGERWGVGGWAQNYSEQHPHAMAPHLPDEAIFFHGINTKPSNTGSYIRSFSSRVDLRGERFQPTLTRSNSRINVGPSSSIELGARWDAILREHLNTNPLNKGSNSWQYRQHLIGSIGSWQLWLKEPDTIPVIIEGQESLMTIADLDNIESIKIIVNRSWQAATKNSLPLQEGVSITENHLDYLASLCRTHLFRTRFLRNVEVLEHFIVCTWSTQEDGSLPIYSDGMHTIYAVETNSEIAGGPLHKLESYGEATIINTSHPFGKWYKLVEESCNLGLYGLSERQFAKLNKLLVEPITHGYSIQGLNIFLEAWNKLSDIPKELIAPVTEIEYDFFALKKGRYD